MANAVDILTREFGITNWVTPTGRRLGLEKAKFNPSLLHVVYIDGKPGDIPDKVQGHYTGRRAAEVAVVHWLTRFWDEAEEAAKRK